MKGNNPEMACFVHHPDIWDQAMIQATHEEAASMGDRKNLLDLVDPKMRQRFTEEAARVGAPVDGDFRMSANFDQRSSATAR
jgi:hypothetical protein